VLFCPVRGQAHRGVAVSPAQALWFCLLAWRLRGQIVPRGVCSATMSQLLRIARRGALASLPRVFQATAAPLHRRALHTAAVSRSDQRVAGQRRRRASWHRGGANTKHTHMYSHRIALWYVALCCRASLSVSVPPPPPLCQLPRPWVPSVRCGRNSTRCSNGWTATDYMDICSRTSTRSRM